MNRIRNLILPLLALYILAAGSAALAGDPAARNLPSLTDISVEDNRAVIRADAHFTFTMYSPQDPYKVIIEIPSMRAGAYNARIISEKEGISEILPSQVDTPAPFTRIEVTLQSPSVVIPRYENNALILDVTRDAHAVAGISSEPAESTVEHLSLPVPAVLVEAAGSESPKEQQGEVPPGPKASEINNIELKKVADVVKVVITGNGSMTPNVFPINERIVIDIPGVTLNAAAPQSLLPPLKAVRTGKHKGKVRFVLDLREKTSYDVAAVGNTIEVSLAPKEGAPVKPAISPTEAVKEMPPAPKPAVPVLAEPQEAEEGKFKGKTISLDFQDADIIPIFRLLADISGYNIVVNPDVKGKITLKLINVPWDQALDIILRTFSLSKIVEGNIMRIVPVNIVSKELAEVAQAKKAEAEAGDLKTRVFPVNYADLQKLRDALDKAKVVSSRGSITLDERASSFIVNDLEKNLLRIEELISELDREEMQARQVLIEARIVEVNTGYTEDLGVQWGAFWKNPGSNSMTIGKTSTASGGGPGNFLVNLPAAVGLGSGGQIGFGYINAAASIALDLQLSALEQMKKGRIISNPRIMTMNNQEAKISQGSTIYIQSTATGGNTIDFKPVDALLSLSVKPRIAPGGGIFMELNISKDAPGPQDSAGNTTVLKNTAQTSVLVNNAETVVIGGIYIQDKSITEDGIPGLNKLPVLNWLFKKELTRETTSELLIFITPKIVEMSALK